MSVARAPWLLRRALGSAQWHGPDAGHAVHLTFDDGPTPAVTPWVLDLLAAYEAKATFFVLGRNCALHPQLLQRIRSDGHAIGNHTWSHADGWAVPARRYLRDVLQAQPFAASALFRPPYGRVAPAMAALLSKRFSVVMWSVLSMDFDTRRKGEECARIVLNGLRPGSIIVFHDSMKAEPRLRVALPLVLEHLRAQGYACAPLPEAGFTAARR
jgi:peptidoglycan/xylan/chitin deacetylase (PgdA/CDA1 family)